MEAEPDIKVIAIIIVIVICIIGAVFFFFTTPKIIPPQPPQYYHITFISEIKHYTLGITSNDYSNSITVTNQSYDIILKANTYHIEACYYNIENNYECESKNIIIDKDMSVELFADWGK